MAAGTGPGARLPEAPGNYGPRPHPLVQIKFRCAQVQPDIELDLDNMLTIQEVKELYKKSVKNAENVE